MIIRASHGILTYIIITLLIVIQVRIPLVAQDVKIKSITVADGLAQGFVPAVLEDSRGFMWFATSNGLERYDGYNFKHYKNNASDSTSLIDNRVYSLAEDSLGRIWVSTLYNGLECFDPKTEIFHHFGFDFSKDDPSKLIIPSLTHTKDGEILISSESGYSRIIGVNNKAIEDITFDYFISNKNLPQILPSSRPILLKTNDVFIYNSEFEILRKKVTRSDFVKVPIDIKKSYATSTVFQTLDDSGFNWIYNNGKLLCLHDNIEKREFNFDIGLKGALNRNVRSYIYQDELDNLWILIEQKLFKILAKDFENGQLNPIEIIDEPICLSIFIDKANKLWIGTNGYGIKVIDPAKAKFKNLYKDHSPNNISLYKDDTYLLSNIYLVNLDGDYLDRVSSLWTVSNGKTDYGILNSYQLLEKSENSERIIKTQGNLRNSTQYFDKQNNWWGILQQNILGVIWSGEDTIQYYNYSDLWNDNIQTEIKSVYESKKGIMWISTSKGLLQIKPDRVTKELEFKIWRTNQEDGLSSNDILCAYDDPYHPDKFIWVGTKGGGINKMDKVSGKCTRYSVEDGLPNDVVYGILYDGLGNLWLSTNFGLSQFNLESKHFRNFTAENDGLQADEFNAGAFFKLDDGRLMFGGVGGVSIFDPSDFRSDEKFGKVYFTQLKINNEIVNYSDSQDLLQQPLSFTKKIDLKHDENFLSISYAGLNAKNLGNENYYYKMEGVDKDWVFAGKKTELSYPNLDPGDYILKVSGVNEVGNRNPKYTSLAFNIASPWWASTLAYLIYGIIACALLVMVFNFNLSRAKLKQELVFNEKQVQHMKELDELKSRFFSNVTHEFRTPLTLIIEPARQLLKSNSPTTKNQSGVIFNNAQSLLLLVNQLLDISKLEENKMQPTIAHGDIIPVLREIFFYFKPLAVKNKQILECYTDLEELIIDFDKNVIEKVLYNLLSNALKFTPENGTITLSVSSINKDTWQFIVKDTGVGIKKSEISKIYDRFYQSDGSTTRKVEGSGIGLSLVKELVKLVDGRIEIDSTPNVGTVFTVTFSKSLSSEDDLAKMKHISSSELMKDVLNPVNTNSKSTTNNVDNKDLTKSTILVVEDNKELQTYIKGILVEESYKVLVADNGEQGTSLAKKHVPDIIISDVMMPLMDGFQLLEKLKTEILTSHIPIILLTAKGSLVSKIKGFNKGAHAYLRKPFNSEELLARLNQIIIARENIQAKIQQSLERQPVGNEENKITEQVIVANQISEIDIKWIEKLKTLVETKIVTGAFTVDDLSSEMFMSRTQFFAKVKALTGLTPGNLVKNTRLELAYQMVINQPEISFSMIADALGMADVKYFRKLFVNKFGQNPSEVRKSLY